MAPFQGHAQILWQYVSGPSSFSAHAYGMAEDPSGGLLVNVEEFYEQNNSSAYIFRFDPSGELTADVQFLIPGTWFRGCGIFPDTVNNGFDVFNPYYMPISSEVTGVQFLITDGDLNVLETKELWNGPNTRLGGGMWLRDRNGDLVYVGVMNTTGSTENFDKLLWKRISTDGDSLDSNITQGVQFRITAAIPTPEGFSVLCRVTLGLGPYPFMTLLRFDADFEYVEGVVLDDILGAPPTPASMDSTSDVVGLAELPNGRVMVSRQFFDMWGPTGTRAYVAVYDATGDLEHIRYAPFPNVRCLSVFQGLYDLGNGHYLWGYVEGEDPSATARTHLVTLDAELNVLGEVIADGSIDNSYHYPVQVLPARDGGAYACGYMRFLNESQYRAWVVKLAAPVGLERHERESLEVQLYPNPGTSFSLLISGPVVSKAIVELVDAKGRLVMSQPIVFNRAMIDGNHLISGAYHYRVVDHMGALRASGTWVRE